MKCEICGDIFQRPRSLSTHVQIKHKITAKEYYDKYLKRSNEDVCVCGNIKKFINMERGYRSFCSRKCSNQSEITKEKIEQTNLKKYGNKCSLAHKDTQEKSKQTILKKYGVEYITQVEDVQNQIRRTCLKKYGVKWMTQSEEVKDRIKRNNSKKYGCHPSQTKKVKEKQKQTNLKKFGVVCPLQDNKVKEKSKQTMVEKFGVDHPAKSGIIMDKFRRTCIINLGVDHPSKSQKVKDKIKQTCLEHYGVENFQQTDERRNYMRNGGAAYMNSFIKNPSKPQVELFELCKELFPDSVLNFPCLNYSIDITIPSLHLAIEYDGSYWHQDTIKDKIRQQDIEEEGWKFVRYLDYVPTKQQLQEDINQISS